MQCLFRYMSDEYAEALVRRGEVMFRALSYYRDYEDEDVRSDAFEGTRFHLPVDGLKVTVVGTGEVVPVPYSFESTAREDDIFVYCLSTERSEELAEKFNTKTCIEISHPAKFLSQIRGALARRPSVKNKQLAYGPVKYYSAHEPVIVDWALPDVIALSKPSTFAWQNEYRIAFAINDAFKVQNVHVNLVPLGARRPVRSSDHPHRLLKLGNISNLCKIYRF